MVPLQNYMPITQIIWPVKNYHPFSRAALGHDKHAPNNGKFKAQPVSDFLFFQLSNQEVIELGREGRLSRHAQSQNKPRGTLSLTLC